MKAHHIIISTISNGLRREILSIYLTIIIWAYNNCACYQDGGDDERREREKEEMTTTTFESFVYFCATFAR